MKDLTLPTTNTGSLRRPVWYRRTIIFGVMERRFCKIVSIVRNANLVRHELGLPACRATDCHFAFAEEV